MDTLARLRIGMAESGIQAILVSDPVNVGWLTGFSGTFGRVIVTPDNAVFVTDSRYTLQASEEVRSMPTAWFASPVDGDEFVAIQAKKLGVKTLAFEATTPYEQWQKMTEKFNGICLVPAADLLADLRMTKSADEIALVREACGIADAAFEHITRMIQPGVTEIDVCLDLEFYIRRQEADIAFPSIVVSGNRSARPHGKPSEKKLEVGDFVTLDFGARVHGYNSDITRTVVVGEASERHREIYSAVLEAQLAAIDTIRAGVTAKTVDGLVRDMFAKRDLAKYFGHGLGHGLGRLVHDSGRLSQSSTNVIGPGQIWTIEPGVYIEGFGGVRIEDDVLITDSGVEVLTHSPKELTILPSV